MRWATASTGATSASRSVPSTGWPTGGDPPPPARPAPAEADGVDLLDLLEATDDELMAAHGRWYIADRDPRYLRRNALVALGNVGDGRHPGTERALRRWLDADDPMLVEHARWAARQLGRDDLVAAAR